MDAERFNSPRSFMPSIKVENVLPHAIMPSVSNTTVGQLHQIFTARAFHYDRNQTSSSSFSLPCVSR